MDFFDSSAHEQVTAAVAESMKDHNPEIEVTAYGIVVKRTERTWVHIWLSVTGNWRVVEVLPDPRLKPEDVMYPAWSSRRGWCYEPPHSLIKAYVAAMSWDGAADSEPSGWSKAIQDGRRHGELKPGIRQV